MCAERSPIQPLVRLVPPAIAILTIILIGQRYSWTRVLAEMQRPEAWGVFGLAVLAVLAFWWLMAAGEWLLVRAYAPARYVDLLCARAACVLLEIASFAAGRGGYGLWLARKYGLPASLVVGLVLYLSGLELALMAGLVALVDITSSAPLPDQLVQVCAILAFVLFGLILVGPFELVSVPFVWTRPWRELSHRRIGALIAVKGVHMAGLVVITATAGIAFGLEVPWSVFAAYLPVIFVVSALPINFAGFGAVQAAWLLLEPWADSERILAFSLIWGLSMTVAAIVRGLPFVGRVAADIAESNGGNRPAAGSA